MADPRGATDPRTGAGEPVVTIAFRTHVWNEAVQLAFDKVVASRRDVVLVVDETNGPLDIPAAVPRYNTTTATFEAMGLPLLPSREEAMWFNGDYILYHLADQLRFDYLFLVEYDCVILGDIDRLLDRLLADGVDYAVKNFGRRRPSYQWRKETMAWFGRKRELLFPYGGLYPAVFISQEAIDDLREGRLEMARAIGRKPRKWVNCEPFSAMQLHLHGFQCRALSHYMDVKRCTFGVPIRPAEAAALNPHRLQLVHPVLAEQAYAKKMVLLEEAQAKARARAELRRARAAAREVESVQ